MSDTLKQQQQEEQATTREAIAAQVQQQLAAIMQAPPASDAIAGGGTIATSKVTGQIMYGTVTGAGETVTSKKGRGYHVVPVKFTGVTYAVVPVGNDVPQDGDRVSVKHSGWLWTQ